MEEYKTFIENIPHYLGGDNYVKPFYSQILREFDCEVENPPGGIPNSCVFNSHFVHMPYYIQYLIETYEQTGGEIEKREVEHLDDVEDFVINCTGIGSNNLVEDDTIEKIKGHLAYVETGFQLEKDGEPFSYAYDINDQSVYCYPQLDRIVLGRTTISEKEENENYDFYSFNGNNIPKHIIDENRKILQDYCGLDILDYEIHGVSGYRPYRKEGPRIEKENYTIHNYGHGGSGVTLSWGSALQVLSLLGVQKQDSIENLKNLFKHQ